MEEHNTHTEDKADGKRKLNIKILQSVTLIFVFLLTVAIFLFFYLKSSPDTFKKNTAFEVLPGMNVQTIAKAAKQQGIVRSDLFLYALLTYLHDPTDIYAGTYLFPEPVDVFTVANKLANNDIENKLIKLTLPEGITVKQMASITEKKISEFDTGKYLELAEKLEGYLYPETYMIPETFSAEELIVLQQKTFNKIIKPLQDDIEKSSLSLDEIVTLASLLEREANDEESMKMVSGILQNRLNIDMPLQADASIEYVLDKPLSQLLPQDLKIDTPYNTYLYKGLPPTPIGNPGIQAIKAVLFPIQSEYLFYITDNDGNFHYAKTFSEHNRNIAKYLR